jgi:hypothetical protein
MFNKIYKYLKKELWGIDKDWQPAKDSIYYGLMTDAEIADMRKRNEVAMTKAKKSLGKKWLLHPSNQVVRNDGE